MNWKKLPAVIVAATITLYSTKSMAQGYVDDALRVSAPSIGGTTRSLSTGGAQVSLGGDIGSLSANPAGLGFYRRSDFSVSSQYNSSFVTSTYPYPLAVGGQQNKDKLEGYNFSNLGIVLAHSSPEADKSVVTDNHLVSFAFGAGYNRNNVFNYNANFGGVTSGNSYTRSLSDLANKYGFDGSVDPFASAISQIALNEHAIDTVQGNIVPADHGGQLTQYGNYQVRGYNDESNLSFGANLGNVVYIGAGVNFNNFHYIKSSVFDEKGINDPKGLIDEVATLKNTYQDGNGVSGKAGIIFNFLNALHIGGYVQTPTNYTINETEDRGLYTFKNGNQTQLNVDPYTLSDPYSLSRDYSFHIRTPYRFETGASLILGKFAFFSADAEYINYKQTKFISDDATLNQIINYGTNGTDGIQNKYKQVVNYRAGAELKFGPIVFRGGYAFYPSPYNDPSINADRKIYSGGIGFRSGNFYIDFGASRDFSNSYNKVFSFSDGSGPQVKLANTRTSGSVTIGTRF